MVPRTIVRRYLGDDAGLLNLATFDAIILTYLSRNRCIKTYREMVINILVPRQLAVRCLGSAPPNRVKISYYADNLSLTQF